MSPRDFYSAVYSTARELGANDVQARLAAAQASEETGYGQSMLGNNAFGIKAGSSYTGPSFTAGTNEEYNGQLQREQANFRAYSGLEESVKDYLGTIQQNFPDAWNATSFSEAVKGLNTGVYGKYATLGAYGNHIKAIDNKYGDLAFAQNPDNVPAPYGPNDQAPEYAVADDVLPVSDPNFVAASGEFAFAQNPSNVPVPSSPTEVHGSLQNAYASETPSAVAQPGEWGVINGVAPVPYETFNQWDAVANAPPIQAPAQQPAMNVEARGLLGGNPGFAANATARPMMNLPASAELGTTPGLEAGVSANLLSAAVPSVDPAANVDAAQNRMDGLLGPSFAEMDFSRMAPDQKTSRIGSNQMEDMGRMLPSIDPMTNTQSFMDQPANLGSFPAGYTAQRGPTTGLLSADSQAVQGQAELALDRALKERQATLMAANPALAAPNFNQALNPSLPGLLTPTATTAFTNQTPQSVQPIDTALGNVATPEQQAAGYQQFASTAVPAGLLSLSGSMVDLPGDWRTQPATVAAVPSLETVEAAAQPDIATVDGPANQGPATTDATDQQRQTSTRTAVRSNPMARSNPSLLTAAKNAINPGTAIGGLIGGGLLSAPGSIAGGLLGNAVYQNGGFRGLLSQPSYSINPIGSGVQAAYSVWGGGTPIGSQAVATDGSRITQMPGGLIGVTGPSGVTTAFDNTGKGYAVFGGMFSNNEQDEDTESESEGGLFSGW